MSSEHKSGSELAMKRKTDEPNTNDEKKQKIVSEIEMERKLPQDVLKRIEVEPGKVVIAGNMAWDTVGKSDRSELYVFHRINDKMVTESRFF